MDPSLLKREDRCRWVIPPTGAMRVRGVIYADRDLILGMDDKVRVQLSNVASLPGIVGDAVAMPDAHWGYGFPIGGVAAFDADAGGVICAGGVGFDISCGVRLLVSELSAAHARPRRGELAEALFRGVPAGLGSEGAITLDDIDMTAMLNGGARWAVERGWGRPEDLPRIEEGGAMGGAMPEAVSEQARRRQRREMGTLGSGNHYLEVQEVTEIFDEAVAAGYGLERGRVVVSIHCGSRGLGHQIGTEFMREMLLAAPAFGLHLPDRELACAPIRSELGTRYLGAMRAAVNCALANREIVAHLTRQVFARMFERGRLSLLFDVSHNTCKVESHVVAGERRRLHVHRKGATRALAGGHLDLPEDLRPYGQPVLIGGSMAVGSYVLVGTPEAERAAFASACHGAGRAMSRHEALRRFGGRQIQDHLASEGIVVKSPSTRGIAEEAPDAYKNLDAVVLAAEMAGLARRVARLSPFACVKG